MATYFVEDASLSAVADAIRAKTGSTDKMTFPNGMVDAIGGISGGGGGTFVVPAATGISLTCERATVERSMLANHMIVITAE